VPWAYVRVNDSGSQVPPGCRAPTSASRPLAVGRCRGSLARQCSIIGRTVGGTRSRLGAPCTTRYRRAAVVPVPNGPSPVAANASTAPRLKMSLDGPMSEPGRPDDQARLRQHGGFGRPGDAEVDDPRPVLGEQHVRRLEVPVHHAHGVDRVEALRQPGGQRQQRCLRQRPVRVDRLGQRGTGHVRRGHPRHRAVHVRIDHLGREHAADPPRRRDLAAEAGPELRVRGQFGPDGLHRHRPAARGDAEEHPSHAALAKLSYQPVRPNRLRIVRLQFPGQRENPHHIYRGRTVLPTEPTGPR
jgi:hypothetical protein